MRSFVRSRRDLSLTVYAQWGKLGGTYNLRNVQLADQNSRSCQFSVLPVFQFSRGHPVWGETELWKKIWRRGRDSLSTLSGKSWRFLQVAILACVYAGVEHILNLGCCFHNFSYCP